jgi:uncharacterized protein YceH (UPF0502 family)
MIAPEPDAVEIRVLGCLVEKQRTTPDVYPLSLNALRSACNQTTNREPIVSYDESMIRDALERLGTRGFARLASRGRALKYRHLLDEALSLSGPQTAVLCVLMLRGPQTLGELKQRTERMQRFDSLDDVEATLDALAGRRLAEKLERRPGQKEQRYRQRLGAEAEPVVESYTAAPFTYQPPPPPPPAAPADPELERRVARLEDEVAHLREAIDALRDELGA